MHARTHAETGRCSIFNIKCINTAFLPWNIVTETGYSHSDQIPHREAQALYLSKQAVSKHSNSTSFHCCSCTVCVCTHLPRLSENAVILFWTDKNKPWTFAVSRLNTPRTLFTTHCLIWLKTTQHLHLLCCRIGQRLHRIASTDTKRSSEIMMRYFFISLRASPPDDLIFDGQPHF